MGRTLAVIGLRDAHRPALAEIGQQHDFDVVPLLTFEQVRYAPSYDIDELLTKARRQLDEIGADGVTSYWDFPSSALSATLAEERGLPTPGLAAIAAFEHKYWSRLVHQQVAPADTPAFVAVDVHDDALVDKPPLPFPFWIKPVKAYSSHLGFRIDNHEDFEVAVTRLRAGIGRLGGPFQQVMSHIDDLPAAVAAVPGDYAICEAIIDGQQCTVEGHVHGGQLEVHGVFDIVCAANGTSFTDYTYPSRLPEDVKGHMRKITADLVAAVGYDNAALNIELFWDAQADRTWILEVNPRISQEHSDLTSWVDGASNLEIMALCALGDKPTIDTRTGAGGQWQSALKHFHRAWYDGTVEHVPTREQVTKIEQQLAPCTIQIKVTAGQRLGDLTDQDSYSYELAYIHTAGRSDQEARSKRDRAVELLDIRINHDDH